MRHIQYWNTQFKSVALAGTLSKTGHPFRYRLNVTSKTNEQRLVEEIQLILGQGESMRVDPIPAAKELPNVLTIGSECHALHDMKDKQSNEPTRLVRKPYLGLGRTEKYNTKLPVPYIEKIKAIAARRGVPQTRVLRDAIDGIE